MTTIRISDCMEWNDVLHGTTITLVTSLVLASKLGITISVFVALSLNIKL